MSAIPSEELFPSIGEVAEKEATKPEDVVDEEENPVQEVESLCMQCGENVRIFVKYPRLELKNTITYREKLDCFSRRYRTLGRSLSCPSDASIVDGRTTKSNLLVLSEVRILTAEAIATLLNFWDRIRDAVHRPCSRPLRSQSTTSQIVHCIRHPTRISSYHPPFQRPIDHYRRTT